MWIEEEHRDYRRDRAYERYYRRRDRVFTLLGGQCVICGSQDRMRLKHKAPEKAFNVSMLHLLDWVTIINELPNVDLLCHDHYYERRRTDLDVHSVDHGGGETGKHNCKCRKCRDKKNEYMRAWRKAQKKEPMARSLNGRALVFGTSDAGSSPEGPAVTEDEFQTVFVGCSSVVADKFYPKGESPRRGDYLRDQGVLYVTLMQELRLRGVFEEGDQGWVSRES